MRHELRHDLDTTLVQSALQAAFASYQHRYAAYGPQLEWLSDRQATVGFCFKGLRLRGRVELAPGRIELCMEQVPAVLRLFRARALQVIDQELNRWMTLAREGRLQS